MIAQTNIFCIDEDNFIKSVRELGTEDIVASIGLTSCLAFFQVDFFSVRNLFLWKTKKISSSRGERISFAEEMDFFCERAPSLAVAVSPLGASVKITASLRFLKRENYLQPNLGFTCKAENWILNENSWQ